MIFGSPILAGTPAGWGEVTFCSRSKFMVHYQLVTEIAAIAAFGVRFDLRFVVAQDANALLWVGSEPSKSRHCALLPGF